MVDEYTPKHAKKTAPVGPDSNRPGKHEKSLPPDSPEIFLLPRQENRANGRRVLDFSKTHPGPRQIHRPNAPLASEKLKSKEKLLTDFGLSTLNRGELINKPDRLNEDHAYIDADNGIFAVFDGAGGILGGAEASATAVRALDHCLSQNGAPDNADDMGSLLNSINRSVVQNPKAGMTTAVVGRVLKGEDGQHRLLYASVGDSRIYHIRGDKIRALTRDEGHGNVVTNSLGKNSKGTPVCSGVHQIGLVSLQKGDSLLFNSDGITGDYEKDFIPEPEIAHLVSSAPTPKDAADRLVRRATKVDDRTALVVKI